MLEENHFSDVVCRELALNTDKPDMSEWLSMMDRIASRSKRVRIALVGKYVQLHDAYLSVAEALRHGGYENGASVSINWIDSETLTEDTVEAMLSDCDGILVPGGFGNRGIEGKILAAKYARENNIPYLGICLGMQTAVIEYFRNVVGYKDAHSTEFDPESPHPVIALMPDQRGIIPKGGTMRLGAYPCAIRKGAFLEEIYGTDSISERHRHRYEVNNDYRKVLVENGMQLSGISPDGRIVEMIEIKEHPWFLATQAHPELKSRPNRPHPLFRGFIGAALEYQEKNN